MKRRTRVDYTPEQKAIIRDRYKQGDSLHDIARMFDRNHSSIMPTIYQTGGYRPPVRKRHKIRDNKTITVISALIKQARELPVELYKTLTWDRGAEMTNHTRFTVATDIQIYFCDLQSPWQRGSNENTNRLLRQYFPKGTDLSVHSQQRLNSVAGQLNERPGKTPD